MENQNDMGERRISLTQWARWLNHPQVIAILVLAISLLGLWFRIDVAVNTVVDHPLRADAGQYFMYAYNLRHHGIYSRDTAGYQSNDDPTPDIVRSPGYPLFLTPFVSGPASDQMIVAVALTQALLASLVILFFYWYSREAITRWGAIPVTLLVAISPHLININAYILTESLFTFLTAGAMLALIIAFKTAKHHYWWLAGAVLGLATLTRPTLLYFIWPLIIFILLKSQPRYRWHAAGGLFIAFWLVLSPWMAHNYINHGTLGDNHLTVGTLHHGMYPNFMYKNQSESYGFPYRFDPESSEISQNLDNVLAELKRRFREEPAKHLRWYLIDKPVALWSWEGVQSPGIGFIYPTKKSPYFEKQIPQKTVHFMEYTHTILVIFGFIGALIVWHPELRKDLGRTHIFVLQTSSLLLLYATAVHIVATPLPRYAIPFLPFLYLLAILAIGTIAASIYRWTKSTLNTDGT